MSKGFLVIHKPRHKNHVVDLDDVRQVTFKLPNDTEVRCFWEDDAVILSTIRGNTISLYGEEESPWKWVYDERTGEYRAIPRQTGGGNDTIRTGTRSTQEPRTGLCYS